MIISNNPNKLHYVLLKGANYTFIIFKNLLKVIIYKHMLVIKQSELMKFRIFQEIKFLLPN